MKRIKHYRVQSAEELIVLLAGMEAAADPEIKVDTFLCELETYIGSDVGATNNKTTTSRDRLFIFPRIIDRYQI